MEIMITGDEDPVLMKRRRLKGMINNPKEKGGD
jgi:hypothetical protein